jgi:hypothetical protein
MAISKREHTAVADGRLSPNVSNVVRRALEQLDD